VTGRPVPRRKRPEEIADYRAWAQMTRAVLGWTDITEDDPIVRTPFRTAAKLPPRTASQLRAMAREQAAEARSRHGETSTEEAADHDRAPARLPRQEGQAHRLGLR